MRLVILLATVLVAGPAFAGSATAKLDRTRASLDDEVMLTINVNGSADTPELPSALYSDFEVQSSGTSNQVSFINGRMSSSTRYTYTLVPKRAGTLTVPAIPVTVDGTRTTTEPIQLAVATANTANPQQAGEEIWLTAELTPITGERQSVFVGEQLVYTLRVFARVNASCPSLKIPDFPNTATYDLGQQREYRTTIDGEEVSVVEVRRAVFPDKAGALEVAGIRMSCTIERNNRRRNDPFGNMFGIDNGVRKVIRSKTLFMSVEALPEPPAGFSGLVGEVTVAAGFSKPEANVGDSVTLSLAVRGTAQMTSAPEPAVALQDAFKIYDDKPSVRYDTTGPHLIGERAFSKALVAQKRGKLDAPPASLVYFDPTTRSYREAKSERLTISISGAQDDPAQSAPRDQAAAPSAVFVGPQAPFAKAALRRASNDFLGPWLGGPRLGALLLVPLAAAFAIANTRRRRRDNTPMARTRREAAGNAITLLARAGEDPAAINRIIRDLIGTTVQHRGPAMSSVEALEALPRVGVPADLVAKAHAVLANSDAVIYGGGKADLHLREDALAFARGLEAMR